MAARSWGCGACWWRGGGRPSGTGRRGDAPAVVRDLTMAMPPRWISTVTARAPASTAFSTSSFTTEAGRSTTSPGGNEVGHMGGEDLNITLYFWLHGASPPFKEFGARRRNAGPGPPSFAGRAGFAVGRWSRLDHRRLEPAGGSPARDRAGIQAFSRESPDAKSRGGMPPAPLVYGPLVGTRSFWRGGAQDGCWAISYPIYVP